MSTRSGRYKTNIDVSPPRSRNRGTPPRSPGRPKKSSPTRSPARKSPARKSPARKEPPKYPARKSPARPTKDVPAPKSPSKRSMLRNDMKVMVENMSLKELRTPRNKRSDVDSKKADRINGLETAELRKRTANAEKVPRRSSRLQETDSLSDARRSYTGSISISQSIDYSDMDNSEDDKVSVSRKLATPLKDKISKHTKFWEFGGRIGSGVLILLLPIIVFSILLACPHSCTPMQLLKVSTYKNLYLWFSMKSVLIALAQCAIQTLFMFIPIFGTKKEYINQYGRKQSFNLWFSCFVTFVLLGFLSFFGILDMNSILNEYFRLSVIFYIIAVILSITLYAKPCVSRNPYGNTNLVLYDFWIGKEISPFIKKLDVKLLLSRISNSNTIILAVAIFTKGFQLPTVNLQDISANTYRQVWDKTYLQYTVLAFSLMQITYIISFVIKEYKITSTFYWQSEGVGYLTVVSKALYPFYFVEISKYIADNNVSLPYYILIASFCLFLLGFAIMHYSNNIKHELREDPTKTKLKHLNTLPTFEGKKLLISSVWGTVRHPNYTGDILIHLALAVPGLYHGQIFPSLPALFTIVVLVHRAWRDHDRCKRRYGAAWQRYCQKVPRVFIPKVI